ncbi:MAG: FecR family protein [Balneolaceae bacterium]
MMDRFAQHDNDKDLPENLLDQFREKDRETVRQIWELLPEVDSGEADITNHETEEALARLNRSLGQSEMDSINTVAEPELQHTLRHHRSQNGRMDRKKAAGRKQEASTSRSMYGRIITLKWLAAAAVLITIGAGWLWLPKTVTIPHGQIASITLPDGSNVELNSGSELRYSRLFSYTHRNIHLNGEAWFGVAQGDDPFVVESNGAVTQVTGTSLMSVPGEMIPTLLRR